MNIINCGVDCKSGEPSVRIGDVILSHYPKDRGSERHIEVSIGLDFMKRFNPSSITELGAVMPSHEPVSHEVVDMYDDYSKCIRVDALQYDYTDRNVLSISTVEHIGRNDYPTKGDTQSPIPENAIRCVRKIIDQSNSYMITFPIGWNTNFDRDVKESNLKTIIIQRDHKNHWIYRHRSDNFDIPYGRPFQFGNAICIITNIEEYLSDYETVERLFRAI